PHGAAETAIRSERGRARSGFTTFGDIGPPGRASGAFDAFAVARAPAAQRMRAQARLIRADEPVDKRQHAEQQEVLSEMLLRSKDHVAEEEEGNPLQLLPEAAEDLQ